MRQKEATCLVHVRHIVQAKLERQFLVLESRTTGMLQSSQVGSHEATADRHLAFPLMNADTDGGHCTDDCKSWAEQSTRLRGSRRGRQA
jgi:hypothetical protein